ncbi:PQQ-dependent sugar dehydrogenase [Haliangium ochraceum]|uniref:Glucose/sorbosone dehydrogenase-like protein n=1 Tax=Haliangium ochraceum (strain DSM 14365 / JCM 11303 / SMP-2) TaxID=502025 RepID=D0LH88_HALO1|nr:PQQ-dependent sugar dehydrogenase [Haliangium ochraceum]ACY18233.1 Glucose/sorbosone dehydrogenase-like protein [Haliangium ochraceum DSM 14365]
MQFQSLRPLLASALAGALALTGAACGDDGGGGSNDAGSDRDAGAIDAPADDGGGGDGGGSVIDAAPLPDAFVAECDPASGTALTTEIVADGDDGIQAPIFVGAPANDRRLFIVEKCGAIKILDDGVVLETPFLDIGFNAKDPEHQRVDCSQNEEGLLGLAFHPQFASNGRFYVNYTEPAANTVIAEYRVSADDPNLADLSEKRIILVDQPEINHNAGMLAFGPDGYLYIGTGDGGGGGDPDDNGQDATTLLGGMLRLDVDGGDPYAIPSDNPFADSANGEEDPRPELWAIGLRNPWRYSFDRDTGDLYIGDVGQRDWEEVNVLAAGSGSGVNFGWNTFEGTHCYPPEVDDCDPTGMTMPVAEYAHGRAGGNPDDESITGGYVYRGACIPDIDGWYFYADYNSAIIRKFVLDGDEAVDPAPGVEYDFGGSIVSFGEDSTGEMYVVDITTPAIRKIVPAPAQ